METSYFINNPNNTIPQSKSTKILQQQDALAFHQSLDNYKPTPLVKLPALAQKFGIGQIFMKDESFRFGLNAFKGLGAVFAIGQLLKKNPHIKTFCTATDGNHGRAVAWGATRFGKQSRIYVPQNTTQNRIKAIEQEGAVAEMVDGDYDYACAHAEKMCNLKGWQLVQDMAWEGYEEIPGYIMAGYMSLFRELEESIHTFPNPQIDIVFMQAGVGSFAGTGAYYYLNRYGKHRPKIVIVEPIEADAIFSSFTKGKLCTSAGNAQTIMAGLNCGTPSLGAWDLLTHATDVALKIHDQYAEKAIRQLYYPEHGDPRIISGESGVGGLAGFMAIMNEDKLSLLKEILHINSESRILFISTEGDTDQNVFNQIIST